MSAMEARARELDEADALRGFRERFELPEGLVYMDGNSLGPLPKSAKGLLSGEIENRWGEKLIGGWNDGWIDLPHRLGAKIARLIGAKPSEVLVCDSTTVNLYKLVLAALEVRLDRHVIVTEEASFPTNAYVLQGCARQAGRAIQIRTLPSEDGISIAAETIEGALDGSVALLTLNHVAFKSGWMHDMKRLSTAARNAGSLVLWDLSHSVGAVPIDLGASGADVAVGCCYKYLNGGPGAPAFLYVRQEIQERLLSPIQGWFGQQDAFSFGLEYRPKAGIGRFLAGTPPILSMAAIEAGADLILEAGIEALRAKSIALADFLIHLYDQWLAPLGVGLGSPREASRRGSHVSLVHPDAYAIDRALIEEMNVVPDFRTPDNIRFGLAPLYTRFLDVYASMESTRRVILEGRFENYRGQAGVVT